MPDANPDKINIDTDSWVEGQGLVQQVAFTSAGAKGQILQEIRNAVDAAINDGISIAQFAKRFDAIADSYVDNWQLKGDRAWRGQLIYSQNIRQAYGAGRYRQMTEPDTLKRRPYWIWRHGDSRIPRPTHLAMNNKVFAAGTLQCFPPCGFSCRCTVFSVSQRDIDREGLKVEDVSDFEADKGFQHLPGKLTKERRDELIKGLDPDIRKLVLGDTEAEFAKIQEGTTRTVNGRLQVLKNSRWHSQRHYENENRPIGGWMRELDNQSADGVSDDRLLEIHGKLREQLLDGMSRNHAVAITDKIDFTGIKSDKKRAAVKEWAAEFFQMTGGLGASNLKAFKYTGDRANADGANSLINVGNLVGKERSKQTIFHELGHFAEDATPNHGNIDWIKTRATGEPRPLAELEPDIAYGADEMAYPDKFIDHYVGKTYEDGGTEVISMGLEHFTSPKKMLELWQQDPEHFKHIIKFLQQSQYVQNQNR